MARLPRSAETEPALGVFNGAYNVVESCFVRDDCSGLLVVGGKGNVLRNNRIELVTKELSELEGAKSYWEPVAK